VNRVAASRIREEISDTLNRVSYRRERVVIERYGKPIAAVVPIEDLELLERLEDRLDIEEAKAALAEAAETGTTPWEEFKAELGL